MAEEETTRRLLEALTDLGLTQYEAKAYLALLAVQPANAHEIGRAAGVPGPKIYETMSRLVDKGLAQAVDSDPITYYGLPLEEFVKLKESEFRRNKRFLLASAKNLRANRGEDLLWHLRGFDACMAKVVELIGRATSEVLVSFWPEHGRYIEDALRRACDRGVPVFSMQFAPPWLELGTVYRHVPIEAVHGRHGSELCLAVDNAYGFFMRQIPGRDWEGYWTASPGVARLVVNYIRHDIYINKAVHDFADQMFSRYGPQLERLIEI